MTAKSFATIVTSLALLLTTGVAPAAADTAPVEAQVDLISDLTLTSATVDQRTGLVTVMGTVVCAVEVDRASVSALVRQTHGGDAIIGFASRQLQCTGEPEAFAIQVVTDPSTGGRFRKGWTLVTLIADACSTVLETCEFEVTDIITLRLTG